MDLAVAAAVFPLIFIGELPDKTMFASLVLAARGRPFSVWVGATLAFSVHVVIAVSIGVGLFQLLPHRLVNAAIAVLFAAGAVWSWRARNAPEEVAHVHELRSALRTVATATGVIFVAEWGDLTQILTANLAARYHSPLSVGVGALGALVAVAALAVAGGHGLLRRLPMRWVRIVTAAVLAVLAAVVGVSAARG
ncbi:MAG: TMEM165/GDT1 family protein [Acidimicrobiales bacterium]